MKNLKYHEKQFCEIKRSTVAFAEWLDPIVELGKNKKILDIGCGGVQMIST